MLLQELHEVAILIIRQVVHQHIARQPELSQIITRHLREVVILTVRLAEVQNRTVHLREVIILTARQLLLTVRRQEVIALRQAVEALLAVEDVVLLADQDN